MSGKGRARERRPPRSAFVLACVSSLSLPCSGAQETLPFCPAGLRARSFAVAGGVSRVSPAVVPCGLARVAPPRRARRSRRAMSGAGGQKPAHQVGRRGCATDRACRGPGSGFVASVCSCASAGRRVARLRPGRRRMRILGVARCAMVCMAGPRIGVGRSPRPARPTRIGLFCRTTTLGSVIRASDR